jgi:glutamate synthase domain-containing protein 3
MNTDGIYYRELNAEIRRLVADGQTSFELDNVKGQRYIAAGLAGELDFLVHGTPGQDLGAFMQGPRIRVEGNVQDGVGNTMDEGVIAINGMAGDVLGYGLRGGRIYVKGDVGYRVGIHMKAYLDKYPVIVIGGKAGDFLGEYMAGGAIILLGQFSAKPAAPICGRSLGTGMHGGVIYVRGEVPCEQLGPGLTSVEVTDDDQRFIAENVTAFAAEFKEDPQRILNEKFFKVLPFSHRPYGGMYVPC